MSRRIPTIAELEREREREERLHNFHRGQQKERERCLAIVREYESRNWPTQQAFRNILEDIQSGKELKEE